MIDNSPEALLPHHRLLIRESAIASEVAEARGYRSATEKQELLDLGFAPYQAIVPTLVVPIHTVCGEVATYQIRPDRPRVTKKGREVKYETPKDSRLHIDVPPTVRDRLGDPSRELWITEGARKADAAVSHAVACIALLGVWGWRGTNAFGGKAALGDWSSIALEGRHVYIAFDSDVTTKQSVAQALLGLVEFLQGRGAVAHIVQLQPGPKGEKVGLDDYLAGGGDVGALRESADTRSFLENARKPTKVECEVDSLINGSGVEKLFHTPSGDPYALVAINGVLQTMAMRSERFRAYLAADFFKREGTAPTKEALTQTRLVMEGKALVDGEEIEVFTRLAPGPDNTMYLDLGDAEHRAVRIDGTGWEAVKKSPVRFRRPAGLLALPEPIQGGSLLELRDFVNVRDEDFALLVGWLVTAVRHQGPYPILCLHGEHGSAKSTTSRVLRELIDPNKSDLRGQPRTLQDLAIAAENSWCQVYDNLSGISSQLSDGLCRLSTGGGFATRRLYTDFDEVIFDAQRPIILNGISDTASRADLIDRMIVLELPRLERYREEREFWRDFEAARPRILGALLTAASAALRHEEETRIEVPIRMADAARWVTAAEPALGWEQGTFVEAYATNRRDANELALEASSVIVALREFIGPRRVWTGTAGTLLDALAREAGESVTREKSWPKTARGLGSALRRLAPNLRVDGIEIEFGKRESSRDRRRLITITKVLKDQGSEVSPDDDPWALDGAGAHTAPPVGGGSSPPSGLGFDQPSGDRPAATTGAASSSDDADGSDGRPRESEDPDTDAWPGDWDEL
ncbi:MAG: DUF3854 domain-containing protein [Deltaproteobacteria bacterium]|nr:DUF3854 domain-containing protein [Deltaproteobacteria bacterium]